MLCPIWVGLSWLLLLPIDSVLKRRIIKKAIRVRTAAKNLTVIGITGSVGKTTTKELLKHMLAPIGAIATPAHMNAEIGVARWITQVVSPAKGKSLPKILIVEMGAYRKGEIALLSDIVQPSIGIVTYVGSQHLALFGSREAICEAKGELLRALPKDGHAFLNADNDMVAKLKTMCRCPVTTVGTDGRADIPAFDIEETAKGIRFKALDTVFDVSLAGTHCVTSVLLAIGTARKLGMSLADIAKQLRTFTSLAGTFEVREMCGVTVLDDTYNLSPQSFKAAIEWAKGQPHARKVLISEGIIELGTDEGAIHRELARDANAVFERVIVTHPRFLPYFSEEGFDDQAMLVENAKRTEKGDLLVCVGRMPKSTIERLLPAE